jgi:hypothetical protein
MLPPEAIAELRRIRLRNKTLEIAAEAALAALIHAELYPQPPPSDHDNVVRLERYLLGR